ncbi:hypothetical protein TIFTF001_000758 [Ficus carica]|uniref:Transmembrane protein n=1 Tax=Ficus carica TaxID=3494 RepID=A0AA87Z5T1_FICCA|nr:hypothetical protein TIFTF001_000758 [Ficus carica]
MTGEKSRDFSVAVVFLLLVLSLPRLHVVAQDDAKELSNGVGLDIFSEFINGQIKNFTAVFKDDIKKHYGFCITDVDADYNGAFNFSKDIGFLSACTQKTKGINHGLISAFIK